jgi:glycosyltransferase involved in cell wall biosynthesis
MRIAEVSPLYESVPPTLYGGTERVVSWLTEELLRRGHEVTLFASGDSKTRARLVPVIDQALRLGGRAHVDPLAQHLVALEMVRERASEFDIVHSHVDYITWPLLRDLHIPMVVTTHGRLDLYGLETLYRTYDQLPLVSISDAQREAVPHANFVATVHHGLPVRDYPMGPGGDHLVFLGRIHPEKRPHIAIQVALRARLPLVIAAKVDVPERRYFESEVRPLLSGPGIHYIGEVDDGAKMRLLGNARAVLSPALWPEPFGLVMVEAMACGTPVVARRCGSIPEIVRHRKTGFVCDDDDELVEGVMRAGDYDRRACRKWVEERFSVERMTDDYEELFERMVAAHGRRPHDHDLDAPIGLG